MIGRHGLRHLSPFHTEAARVADVVDPPDWIGRWIGRAAARTAERRPRVAELAPQRRELSGCRFGVEVTDEYPRRPCPVRCEHAENVRNLRPPDSWVGTVVEVYGVEVHRPACGVDHHLGKARARSRC